MQLKDADVLKQKLTDAIESDGGFYGELTKALLEKFVDDIPNVEPKRGKWEPYMFGDERWHMCSVCSECGQVMLLAWNYCPKCGAKMEGYDEH